MNLRKTLAVVLGLVFLTSGASAFAQGPGGFSPVSADGPVYSDGTAYNGDYSVFETDQGPLWRPYVELQGSFGDPFNYGSANMFAPLFQNDQDMFYIDFRGVFGEEGRNLGTFGGGYRRLMDNGLIFGSYGFFDYLRTPLGNEYKAGTLGFELLDEFWDLRIDATIPESDRNEYACNLDIFDDNLVIRHFEEAAYYGGNIELGVLTARSDDEMIEWRNYAGVYAFDHSDTEYEPIYGPRLRTELRLFDLPWLGSQSRVVLGGQVQYDDVRGTQGAGQVAVRIALGRGPELHGMDRRMLEPIRRNTMIVTQDVTYTEGVKVVGAGGGAVVSGFINSDTVDPEGVFAAAGPNSVVLFSGDGVANGGIIQTDTGFIHNIGQTALGAGGVGGDAVIVMGLDSGKMFELNGGGFGTRPTVQGIDPLVDVFTLADDGSILGIDIIDGQNGIFGADISGFTINDVTLSGPGGTNMNGLLLTGTNSGDIFDSHAFNNGANGFFIETYEGGVIRGNSATSNMEDGFNFGQVTGNAVVIENSAFLNVDDGFQMDTLDGNAVVAHNQAVLNMGNGFNLGSISGALIFSHNDAFSNDLNGFQIGSMSGDAIVSNNRADGNTDGFNVGSMTDNAQLTNNLSTGNREDGFELGPINGEALVFNNSAIANVADGFHFTGNIDGNALIAGNYAERNQVGFFTDEFVALGGDALFVDNTAFDNDFDGFAIYEFTDSALMARNTAEMNGENGFLFGMINGGSVFENTALDNSGDGFNIGGMMGIFGGMNDGLVAHNISTGNVGDGFEIANLTGGSVEFNTADMNIANGFNFSGTMTAGTVLGNTATMNMINGFLFNDMQGGLVHGNTSIMNVADGFRFDALAGGSISNNTSGGSLADANGGNGFQISNMTGGDLVGNEASFNVLNGILINGTATGNLIDNTANSSQTANGILVTGDFNGNVNGNTTNTNAVDGINITGDLFGSLIGNTALTNADDGINIGGSIPGIAFVIDNVTNGNGTAGVGSGLVIGGDVGVVAAFVSGNTADNNQLNGIDIGGSVAGILDHNRASGNVMGSGILVGGDVGGPVAHNIALGNNLNGISITGAVFGDVIGNDTSFNTAGAAKGTAHGLFVGNGIVGDLNYNISSNNTNGDGIHVIGGVTGDMIGNVMNFNDPGAFIDGDVGGDVGLNVANNNAGQGIWITGGVGGNVFENVTGFDMASANGDTGLQIDGAVSGDLRTNISSFNGGNGMLVGSVGGDIRSNIANSNTGFGIEIDDFVTGDIIDNETNNNMGGTGLYVLRNVDGSIIGNTANDNSLGGIEAESVGGDVLNNTTNNNLGYDGLFVFSSIGGSLNGNTALMNNGHGIFAASVTGDVLYNTTNENLDGNGLTTLGSVGGSVNGNTALMNSENGIDIGGGVGVDVNSNVANDNMLGGIEIGGTVGGDVLDNETIANLGSDGMFFGMGIDGDVTGNTSTGNTMGSGIYVTDGVGGSVLDNILNDNTTGTVKGSGSHGLFVGLDVTGDVMGNTANGNTSGDGLHIDGSVLGTFGMVNNTAIGNDPGIFVGVDVAANLSGNIVMDNAGDGIQVVGNVGGNVLGNLATGNGTAMDEMLGGNGISIGGNVGEMADAMNPLGDGEIASNITTGNFLDGLYVAGNVFGDIATNTSNMNGEDGIDIDGQAFSNIIGNTTNNNGDTDTGGIDHEGNGENGFEVGIFANPMPMTEKVFAENTSNENEGSGFVFGTFGMPLGGDTIFRHNTAMMNGLDGLTLTDLTDGGIIGDGNNLSMNGRDGLRINGEMSGGVIFQNTLNENTEDGMHIVLMSGGLVGDISDNTLGNLAVDNGQYGFYVETLTGGTLSRNLAFNNIMAGKNEQIDGYHFGTVTGGTVRFNSAFFHTSDGFEIEDEFAGGLFDTNLAQDNMEHGFNINNMTSAMATATLNNNQAISNDMDGIFIAGPTAMGTLLSNDADNNVMNGIHIAGDFDTIGDMSFNTADFNGMHGFLIEGDFLGGGGDDILSNMATNNQLSGMRITGSVTGDILSNTFSDNTNGIAKGGGEHGLFVGDGIVGNLSNNIANSNDNGDGLHIEANAITGVAVTGNVNGNTTNFNDPGILLNGDVLGSINNNTALSNDGDGILVNGDVGSGLAMGSDAIFENTLGRNGDDGLDVEGLVTGNVSRNDAFDNGMGGNPDGNGLELNNVNGNIEDNVAGSQNSVTAANGTFLGNVVGNTGDGIQVIGSVVGNVDSNIANSNGEDGIDLQSVVGPGGTDGFVTNNTTNGNGFGVDNEGNGGNGLEIETVISGTYVGAQNTMTFADGNRSTLNANDGFLIVSMSGGRVVGNLAGNDVNNNGVFEPLLGDSRNGGDGFQINSINGGTFDNNRSELNLGNGYNFVSGITGGNVFQNVALGNGLDGFLFNGNVLNGITHITGNEARRNSLNGYHITGTFGTFAEFGNVAAPNVAFNNLGNGFFFEGLVNGGTISHNTAGNGGAGPGNALDGFNFVQVDNGDIFSNTSRRNGDNGFEFTLVNGGNIGAGNLAEFNDNDGFLFTTIDQTNAMVATHIFSNFSNMNGQENMTVADGFVIGTFTNGLFELNDSNFNTDRGYRAPNPAVAPASYGLGNTGMGNLTPGFDTLP